MATQEMTKSTSSYSVGVSNDTVGTYEMSASSKDRNDVEAFLNQLKIGVSEGADSDIGKELIEMIEEIL